VDVSGGRSGPDDHGIIGLPMNSITRQMMVAALLLAAVLLLFVAAETGQHRLVSAGQRIQDLTHRASALADLWLLLQQAESSERGYILLDNREYLVPFQAASGNLPQVLEHLDAAFRQAPNEVREDVVNIERLSGRRFEEMHDALETYRTRGKSAAVDLMRTDAGERTMEQIDELVSDIRQRGARSIDETSASWHSSRWVNLVTTSTALAASVALVLLLIRLALRHMRSKDLEASELAERRNELERVVEQRTVELSELSTHLQSVAEQEKAALSRELHDELGGLLIAARMDVSWIEDRVASDDPQLREHFQRVHEALQSGVEMKRRVVENLRPSLLDNLGLLSALRWQVADSCGRAGLTCIEHYPEEELGLTPEASIAVFRIVQEALINILKHASARRVHVCLEMQPGWLVVSVRDDGVGLPPERLRALRSHGLAAMRHRAGGLGGRWVVRRPSGGGTEIEVRLPAERVLAAAPTTNSAVGQ
jgi:signal transduction histidine kinase